ncbi:MULTISPECIES: hypothetical protein [unclassified Knoellia]|uniref:hypothetical protein n=1 Tax=Knoellia altitudinis TaxID=3404795 RepID=UPI0036063C79
MSFRFGVEHEYRLWAGTQPVDFRQLLPHVAVGLATLDPGDPRARRLPSTVALTADGWEAELATPPLPMAPDLPQRLDSLLRRERTELARACANHDVTSVAGFSTHLNISTPDHLVVRTGRRLVDSCVGALADAVEPTGSSGIFVRPRRGRLEVGTEYLEGKWLEVGTVLLTACVSGLFAGPAPPVQRPAVVPSREKFGWYVAKPPWLQLGQVWSWARPFALAHGLPVRDLDALAVGDLPLRRAGHDDPSLVSLGSGPGDVGQTDIAARRRPGGVHAQTEWLTWDWVVWRLQSPSGLTCRAIVPAAEEVAFLQRLDAGLHDATVDRLFRSRRRRRLVVHAQLDPTRLESWWHEVRPGALVPAERRVTDGAVPRVSRRHGRRDLRMSRRSAA